MTGTANSQLVYLQTLAQHTVAAAVPDEKEHSPARLLFATIEMESRVEILCRSSWSQ